MVGVIEWIDNGAPTGIYAPYILVGKNKPKMISKDGRPVFFYSRKEAMEFGKKWLKDNESKK